jgi:ABC-type nitrate/sulfonate/bicarbonate transport system ATPase subunit
MMAGIEAPTEGSILLDGVKITGPSAAACLIYQGPSLFPWLTVQKNVEFPLNMQRISRPERREKAEKIIERVGLSGFENRYPHQLSGGMQQRVAIARAIIGNPRVLLMDESFGFLDSQTRFNMQQFLLEIWEFSKKTIVFVTHHVEEAIFLADRIFVMTGRPGRKKKLIEVDIERPRDIFSKRFEEIRKEIFELLQSEVGTFGNSKI